MRDGVVDLDRLTEAVRILDPDILALQEVDRDQPRSQLADLTAVAAEAMGAVTHRFAAALSGTPGATWIAATENDVPGTPRTGSPCCRGIPPTPGRCCTCRGSRCGSRSTWPAPRKMIMVNEEPRAVVIGHLDTPAGPWWWPTPTCPSCPAGVSGNCSGSAATWPG